ncbi:MAG TPA: PDZ domain-containing protein, partial [Bryobacteraceae bacterium]|nr:PDZ domain-containing protein [Bryobacteraceae bacterium]
GGQLGIAVEPMRPELADQIGLPRNTQGLMVDQVDPSGPAAEALQPGDVIQQVNHQSVRTVDELRGAVAKSGDKPALLLVNRKGQTVFIPVRTR